MLRRKVNIENLNDYDISHKNKWCFPDLNLLLPNNSNVSNNVKISKTSSVVQKPFLEPIKLKVKTIQQERIMTVFYQLMERISLLAALPSIISTFEEFHLLVGSQLVNRIQRYTELKVDYDSRAKKLETIRLLSAQQTLDKNKEQEETTTYEDPNTASIPKCLQNLPGLQTVALDKQKSLLSGEQTFSVKRSRQSRESDCKSAEEQNKEKSLQSSQNESPKKPCPNNINETDLSTKASKTEDSGAVSLEEMEKMMWKQDGIERKMKCMVPKIQKAVRFILQGFKKNPSATNAIIHHSKVWFIERSQGSTDILVELEKLKKIVLSSLLTSLEDQREKDEYLDKLRRKDEYNRGKILKLEGILGEALEQRRKAVDEKNKVILDLQNHYHCLEKSLNKSLHKTTAKADEKKSLALEVHSNKRDDLRGTLQSLKKEFQKLMESNRQSETKLRARKWKYENELESIISKHDQTIGDRNTEYEDIEAEYKIEQNQLALLEENFKVMEVEYKQVMEEKHLKELKEQRKREEERMLLESAVTIQAFYRSFKTRRQLKRGRGGKK